MTAEAGGEVAAEISGVDQRACLLTRGSTPAALAVTVADGSTAVLAALLRRRAAAAAQSSTLCVIERILDTQAVQNVNRL
jgi:hypothetical protein